MKKQTFINWLEGEKYIIHCKLDEMTEQFEKEHSWELSRNRMIEKTLKYIDENWDQNGSSIESIDVGLDNKRDRRAFLGMYNIKLHWHQRLWLGIYCTWYELLQKLGVKR